MEQIKDALNKAKSSQRTATRDMDAASPFKRSQEPSYGQSEHGALNLPHVELDCGQLEKNRIVSYEMRDQSHVAFNILRTTVYQIMMENGWKSIAISSPNPGAGKTTVALNLAFSLARQKQCKVVVVDLDLRRPAIAKTLGIPVEISIGQYLTGRVEIQHCMIQIADNLIAIPNVYSEKVSSELMINQRGRDLTEKINDVLSPDIIIYDLPPTLSSDDAIGFLPYVDCGLIVIGEGDSRYGEVNLCDEQFATRTNLIGHVLNKSADKAQAGYHYDD
ncbi:MAG: CpsD/CapB family tyrosine-protein kinase [Rhizobiaceae bacterium]